jgi:6-phosphogluconolactonase/glucosamine-6-phosphate isomerase/deaminase
MTLSLPLIKASALNIVLCFGSEKGEVFKRVKTGPSKQFPISLLNKKNTVWFLDEDAFSVL